MGDMSPSKHLSAAPVVKDPVCGMDVDPAMSEYHSEHDGQTYYFCSEHCRAKFDAAPGTYVPVSADVGHEHDDQAGHEHRGTPATGAAASGEVAEWTCPMHPEIRRPGPGTCPICGMALEPVTVTADSGPNPELADMTRRFKVAVALTIPVARPRHGPRPDPRPPRRHLRERRPGLQLVLATPVVLWAGGRSSSAGGPRCGR